MTTTKKDRDPWRAILIVGIVVLSVVLVSASVFARLQQ